MAKEILRLELLSARGEDRELFRELDALGIDSKQSRSMLEDSFEELADVAFSAYRSAVPVRTKQLRGFLNMKSSNRVLKIIEVKDTLHTRSNTNEPIPGDLLADILEEGRHRLGPRRKKQGRPYKRSKNAIREGVLDVGPTGQGSPTANWADNAFRALSREIDRGGN